MSSQTPLLEPLDRYECRACGYVYEPEKGDSRQITPGTAFSDLPAKWACPVCSAPVSKFDNIGPVGSPSGFKENLSYGTSPWPKKSPNLWRFRVFYLNTA
jgi:rubredoxin